MWILDIEQGITNLQSTLPEKLVNKEDPKRDKLCPLEKGKGSLSPEQIENMGRGRRELQE